jgi:uncharacterized protein (TIGR04141 family)
MSTKTNRISLYRLRDLNRPSDLELEAAGYELISEGGGQKLFVKFEHRSSPTWRNFISKQLQEAGRDVANTTSSFILLHDKGNRRYAVTGGYGYTRIEKFAEKEFGIEVAKRLISRDRISGLSQRVPRGELRQVLRTFSDYDPSKDRDNLLRILQSVFGRGSFEGRSSRIEGKTAVILRTSSNASDLGNVIEAIENVLLQGPTLEFVQHFDVVTDPVLTGSLARTLQQDVFEFWNSRKSRDNFYVEFDDYLQQFRTTQFKISLGRRSVDVDDFDLELIRTELLSGGVAIGSIDDLLRLQVAGFGEDGNITIGRTTLWEHTIGEIRLQGEDYLKFRGQWLRLREELNKVMNERIAEVPVLTAGLPAWDKSTLRTEFDYNKYVAGQNGWHCMDRDFVQLGGFSRLELCDLYDPSRKRFFHVKETWGSKSSYLFSQGVVAGESFHSDQSFRDQCCQKWPFLQDYPSSHGEIVFGVAASDGRIKDFPGNLTYFAKLSLCTAVDALQRLGYQVSLCPVVVQ